VVVGLGKVIVDVVVGEWLNVEGSFKVEVQTTDNMILKL